MILIADMCEPDRYETAGGSFKIKRKLEAMTGHPCVVMNYPDVSTSFVERYDIRAIFKKLGFELVQSTSMKDMEETSADGAICAAVLQHLPRGELFDAVVSVRRLLRPGGRVLASIPTRRSDIDEEGRDEFGRYFSRVQPEELERLFQRAGFRTLDRWDEEHNQERGGLVQWATLLFELVKGE